MTSPNNDSRRNFIRFCDENDLQPVGRRNAFVNPEDDKTWAYAEAPGGLLECRQFYEDYDGGMVIKNDKGEHWISRNNIKISEVPNRIMTNGTKAFQANAIDLDVALSIPEGFKVRKKKGEK